MIGIYKITSPSGKIYIGQSVNIENRWKYYNSLMCKQQRKLYNSLLKYTPQNHIFEILEECSINELTINESLYINKFNSIKDGLNIREAGNHGYHSEETKQLMRKPRSEDAKKNMSLSRIGIQFTEDQCKKISSSKTNHSCYNAEWYSKMMEGRKNIIYNRSEQHTKSIIEAKSIAILQLDKDNNIINKWKSAADAARHLDGFNQPNIQRCVSGNANMYKGYKWVKNT
jgi:group I intron endonuclease